MKSPFFKFVLCWNIISILLFYLLFFLSEGTLSPKSSKSPKEQKPKADKVKSGPVSQTVFDRNLVVEHPSAKDILNNHQAYFQNTKEFNVDGMVLGYVTPWNNHGYDVAKIFANKFTHISPVWLQIKRKGKQKYEVTGTHDVDKKWMNSVINAGIDRGVRIVPRILFDGWSLQDFNNLFQNAEDIETLAQKFVNTCKKWKFNGLVMEIWSQLAGRIHYELIISLIKHVSTTMQNENLDLILVIPPKRAGENQLFTANHFNQLYDFVTAFSLMTYDYSSIQRPGPNSPIEWVKECIKYLSPDLNRREKILTGLNFYGNAYTPNGGSPIVAHEYITLLKNLKDRLQYDPDSAENYFEVKNSNGRHIVFYPTLHSISKHLMAIKQLGTGISIWELGQGLDYFYDLL